jgi:hypothetical protein
LSDPPRDDLRDSNWLLRLGIGLTVFWVALQAYYIVDVVGFQHFVDEGPPSVGGFLEGAFAPLAFLWLVIGFFLQREELQRSSHSIDLQYQEMRRATEQAEVQARAIAANEMHSRQEAFLRVVELIQQQLSGTLGQLYMSSQAIAAGGKLSTEEIQALWSAQGGGDRYVFGRALIGTHFQGDRGRDTWTLFWSTPIRTRHTTRFLEIFDRMLEQARDCDTNGLLVDTLLGSVHGQVYALMRDTRSIAPPVT